MWTYKQDTGEMSRDGVSISVGYSGRGIGLNNPAHDTEPNVGPIPRGKWIIGPAFAHPLKGPFCMRLKPLSAQHRAGFMIHGDNSKADKSASQGCIIMCRDVRVMIGESYDKILVVT